MAVAIVFSIAVVVGPSTLATLAVAHNMIDGNMTAGNMTNLTGGSATPGGR